MKKSAIICLILMMIFSIMTITPASALEEIFTTYWYRHGTTTGPIYSKDYYDTYPNEYDGPGEYEYNGTTWVVTGWKVLTAESTNMGDTIRCLIEFQATAIRKDCKENGHDWGEASYTWEYKNNNWNCTASRSCQRSGNDGKESETVTASLQSTTLSSTCTRTGSGVYTAVFTNTAFSAQTEPKEIPATGHEWGGPSYSWAQENGAWKCTAKRVCVNNPDHEDTETVVAVGEQTKDPTCTEYGETTYTASFESNAFTLQTKKENDIPPLDHVSSATLTAGETTHWYECERDGCDAVIGEEEHDFSAYWAVDGSTHILRCICGKTQGDPESHNFVNMSDEEGKHYMVCKDCEYSLSDEPADHTLAHHDGQAPTCTEPGWEAYDACTQAGCGYTTYKEIRPTGHIVTATAAKAATCTEPGNSAYWYCANCRKYFSDEAAGKEIEAGSWVIEAAGHNLVATAAKPATCTEPGNSAYWTCSVCGKLFSDEAGETETDAKSVIIEAKGHDLEVVPAQDATETSAGNSTYWRCKICGKYFGDAEGTAMIDENSWVIPAKGEAAEEKGQAEKAAQNDATIKRSDKYNTRYVWDTMLVEAEKAEKEWLFEVLFDKLFQEAIDEDGTSITLMLGPCTLITQEGVTDEMNADCKDLEHELVDAYNTQMNQNSIPELTAEWPDAELLFNAPFRATASRYPATVTIIPKDDPAEKFAGILAYLNGKWIKLNTIVNDDDTVTFVLTEPCVLRFVYVIE